MIPLADGGGGGETLGEAARWKESLARVIPAIVVVRVCSTGAFDGDGAGYSKATGFVVDKARGIILTNRHVVAPGKASSPTRDRVARAHSSNQHTTRTNIVKLRGQTGAGFPNKTR